MATILYAKIIHENKNRKSNTREKRRKKWRKCAPRAKRNGTVDAKRIINSSSNGSTQQRQHAATFSSHGFWFPLAVDRGRHVFALAETLQQCALYGLHSRPSAILLFYYYYYLLHIRWFCGVHSPHLPTTHARARATVTILFFIESIVGQLAEPDRRKE